MKFLAAVVFLAVLAAPHSAAAKDGFCWKDSHPRGAGTIPPSRVADCPEGYTNNGATCGRGADTYSNPSYVADCPEHFKNMGASCYRAWPPKSISMDNMTCRGEDKRHGGRCYPACKDGYTNNGETCGRGVSTLGMDSMVCKDNETRTAARCYPVPPCGDGKHLEDSKTLCYKDCPEGMDGVGPVCWSRAPRGWVACGAGFAKSKDECAKIIGSQVGNTAMMVGTGVAAVATAGGADGAIAAAKAGANAAKIGKLKEALSAMKEAVAAVKEAKAAAKAAKAAKEAEKAAKEAEKAAEEAEKARAAGSKLQAMKDAAASASERAKDAADRAAEAMKDAASKVKNSKTVQAAQDLNKATKTERKVLHDEDRELELIEADAPTDEDIARTQLELAGLADPTNAAATAAAFTYPKCSELFTNGDAD